jgi:serine/threonine-protein kinase HipA
MAEETVRYVTIQLPGEQQPVPAGLLTLVEEGRRTLLSRYTYGRGYLRRPNALAVDPVSLPLGAGAERTDLLPVGGLELFGALRDATPDLWGRRVIENRLRADPDSLPESVFLDRAGPHRAGALGIQKTLEAGPAAGDLPDLMELEHLLEAADRVEAGLPVPAHLELFFAGAPSLGGARPKALLASDGHQWIAKFPSRNDPFDVPAIERATLELARQAGLAVPPTRLETLPDGRNVMLIQRFDRGAQAEAFAKRHMVSALTALGVHEQDSASMRYADIARAIEQLGSRGQIQADRTELFRRMVFNILVSNDDDHLRNHAFLYDAGTQGWRLSPLYDVVPRPSASQERYLHLGVGPQGRTSTLGNALDGCEQFGLAPAEAAVLIDGMVRVVREWKGSFEALAVPGLQIDRISSAFRRASDIGMAGVTRLL